MTLNRRQPIRLFFIRLIAFALLFCLLDTAIPYVYVQSLNRLDIKYRMKMIPADVIVLGASHTAAAIDPAAFRRRGLSAVNLSLGGEYTDYHRVFYRSYRKKNPPPRVMIISAPIFMFRASDLDPYIYLMDADEFRRFYFQWDELLSIKLFRYREIFARFPVFAFFLMTGKHRQIHGYYGDTYPSFRHAVLTQRAASGANPTRREDYLSSKLRIQSPGNRRIRKAFHELLTALERDNVKVILAETPEYTGTITTWTNREFFYEELRHEISNYNNVHFLPHTEFADVIDSEDLALFKDGGYGTINSHLSYAGSQAYSRAFVEWILATFPGLSCE